jgi:hypothetical protein
MANMRQSAQKKPERIPHPPLPIKALTNQCGIVWDGLFGSTLKLQHKGD